MYEPPELRAATDAWWQGLARHFRAAGIADVPDALTRPDDPYVHWAEPALLFSQTCGYPLTHACAGKFTVLATPCYTAPGCEGTDYRSLLIVPESSTARTFEDLRGRTACYNSEDSHSGHNVLRATFAPLARDGRFFGRVVRSGGHIRSAAMIAAGEADVAALDCVTHALYARHAPWRLEGTRVLAQTEAAPGLPYVTASATDPRDALALREGITSALADPALAPVRDALLLAGADLLPPGAYEAICEVERRAVAAGYATLA
jgi:ABC-type phosphate/phosphonate transport system substrate-binding protein